MQVVRAPSLPDGSVTRAKLAPDVVKHARVTTGAIPANGAAVVTVGWATAFPTVNYTAVVSVIEATAAATLRVEKIEWQTAGAIGVRVQNVDTLTARTGTLHAIGLGD